ncbi:uncharacterized protein LOC115929302 [Strongylocentrotus purpuratus]|uniref:C-type lectin domain-containing protein n=1 Tax=Strongylocentrotus purpuratus TaxID=7668 RepID=A0A7M7PPW7_STRPU|nr:uncharacterized protein LOC115929302 [Strongylocentrotus purpuratus]
MCVDKGGALFFPESAESMTFVRKSISTSTCQGFWLGCIDRSSTATGQFECPNQDGVYWNSETDFSGYWDWTSGNPDPSVRGPGDYCTLTLGMGPGEYWIEYPCTYGDVCPACSRKRQLPITTAPSPSMVSDPGSTITLASQSRHRSMIYKATASELGCLTKSYVIVIVTVPTRIRCAALCLAHGECVSFNFFKRETKNCHLSSVSIGSVPDDGVNYSTSCTHYE